MDRVCRCPRAEKQPRRAFISGGPEPALQNLDRLCRQAAGLGGGHSHTPTFAPGGAGGQEAGAAGSWATWVWTEGCPSPSPRATWPD